MWDTGVDTGVWTSPLTDDVPAESGHRFPPCTESFTRDRATAAFTPSVAA
jgi:hypothetical protein